MWKDDFEERRNAFVNCTKEFLRSSEDFLPFSGEWVEEGLYLLEDCASHLTQENDQVSHVLGCFRHLFTKGVKESEGGDTSVVHAKFVKLRFFRKGLEAVSFVFMRLINSQPERWAPKMLQWSLDILVEIEDRVTREEGHRTDRLYHNANCVIRERKKLAPVAHLLKIVSCCVAGLLFSNFDDGPLDKQMEKGKPLHTFKLCLAGVLSQAEDAPEHLYRTPGVWSLAWCARQYPSQLVAFLFKSVLEKLMVAERKSGGADGKWNDTSRGFSWMRAETALLNSLLDVPHVRQAVLVKFFHYFDAYVKAVLAESSTWTTGECRVYFALLASTCLASPPLLRQVIPRVLSLLSEERHQVPLLHQIVHSEVTKKFSIVPWDSGTGSGVALERLSGHIFTTIVARFVTTNLGDLGKARATMPLVSLLCRVECPTESTADVAASIVPAKDTLESIMSHQRRILLLLVTELQDGFARSIIYSRERKLAPSLKEIPLPTFSSVLPFLEDLQAHTRAIVSYLAGIGSDLGRKLSGATRNKRPRLQPPLPVLEEQSDSCDRRKHDRVIRAALLHLLELVLAAGSLEYASDLMAYTLARPSPASHPMNHISLFLALRPSLCSHFGGLEFSCSLVSALVNLLGHWPLHMSSCALASLVEILLGDKEAKRRDLEVGVSGEWRTLLLLSVQHPSGEIREHTSRLLELQDFGGIPDQTALHLAVEQIAVTFFSLVVGGYASGHNKQDREERLESVKRLLVRLAQKSHKERTHILDMLLDFIFSHKADGVLRMARPKLRTTYSYVKTYGVPPANRLLRPTSLFHFTPSVFLTPLVESRPGGTKQAASSRHQLKVSWERTVHFPHPKKDNPGKDTLMTKNKKRKIPVARLDTGQQERGTPARGMSSRLQRVFRDRKLSLAKEKAHDSDAQNYLKKDPESLQESNRAAVVDLIARCVAPTRNAAQTARTDPLSTFADLLLLRLSAVYPPRSVNSYQATLPRNPMFPRDIFLQSLFTENPILMDLIEEVGKVPPLLCKCKRIIRSLLVSVISKWNAELRTDPKLSPHFQFTCRLVNLLRRAEWIPPPLCNCVEIFSFISPPEITSLLMSLWNFIKDFPPKREAFERNKTGWKRNYPSECSAEPYTAVLKGVLHKNITQLSTFYLRTVGEGVSLPTKSV